MFSKRNVLVSVFLVVLLTFGILLYKNYVYATDVIIDLETTISGQINGTLVSGTGAGTYNLTTGISTNEITFSSFPINTFSAPYTKSWHCKHHPKKDSVIADLDEYFIESTMVYSGLASGTLYTNGTVEKTENGTKSEADTTWSGTYSGPTTTSVTDVEFYETFSPTANPKQLSITGYREMFVQGQGTVYCNWTGNLTSLEDIDIDEAFTLTYTWSNVSWNTSTKEFQKTVLVEISQ